MQLDRRFAAALWACLAVLILGGCDEARTAETPAEVQRGAYPTIIRREVPVDPADSVYEAEWARFYPQATTRPEDLWTFEGRLVFKSEFDRKSLGLRVEPVEVVGGHFAPDWIFVRPESDGGFRIRGLPPMKSLRFSITGAPASFGDDYVDVPAQGGKVVELPVYSRSELLLNLKRSDGGPLGRWIVGLRRPGGDIYALRGPNSHPNEGRSLHRFSRSTRENVRFESLHAGEYELTALAVGFGRLRTRITIEPGARLDIGELVIPRGHDLRLEVRPGESAGIPPGLRATATLLETRARFTPNWPARRLILEQEVEDQTISAPVDPETGDALLRGLYGGLYAVRVFPAATNAVQTPPLIVNVTGETSATIDLGSLAMIHGTVLDEEGQPVEGAVVTSRLPLSPDYALQLSASGVNGGFSFLVPEGLHEVTARWRGAAYPRAEVVLRAKAGQDIALPMPFRPTAMFEGTVDLGVARRHEPLLSIHPRIGQWEKIGIPVDSDGTFRESVPAGVYDLFDGTDFLRTVDLSDANVRTRVALDPTTVDVTVEVEDDRGRRIQHAWAALLPLDAAAQSQLRIPPRFADRGRDGMLAMHGVPTGKYALFADAPGFRQSSKPLALVSKGNLLERVVLEPDGGSIVVRVSMETGGRPVEEAMIQQMTVGGGAILLGGRRTERGGAVEIREFPRGAIEFDVAPPIRVPPLAMARVRVEDLGDTDVREVPVQLADGTNVRIAVYEGGLSPVKDATLEVECLRPDEVGERFASYIRHFAPVSGYDGSFPTFAMPRGRPLVLRVRRTGFPVLESVLTPDGDNLIFVEMRYPAP